MREMDANLTERMAERLEREPSRFEPGTAYRVAKYIAQDETFTTDAHHSSKPAPLAISGFQRRSGKVSLSSALSPLVGPLGPLPPLYNEILQREERNKSGALSAFLNLFASHFTELFVRATEKYRLARTLRWSRNKYENQFRKTLLSLAGLHATSPIYSSSIDEEAVLRFCGLFANRNRNANSLSAILHEYTGMPVTIEQFRKRWVTLPAHEQSQLGQLSSLRLGENTTAGAYVEDLSGGFRVVIGPVGYGEYLSLTPGAKRLADICSLARLYVGNAFDFDIKVILKKQDIPFSQLGSKTRPNRLGWNSWARVEAAANDSHDAIVTEKEAYESWIKGGRQ